MSESSVNISGQDLSSLEVKDICKSLKQSNLNLLSLRECKISDDDFTKLIRAVSKTKSLVQLSLNLGIISSEGRCVLLADALNINRSIISLYIHGSTMGRNGAEVLLKSVALHPSIVDLDIGDCCLDDDHIPLICNLLPPDGARPGLKQLSMSSNPRISSHGWSILFCSIASSSCLSSLSVDYNPNVGDSGARMLAVVMCSNRTLENVDLENCGITENVGKLFVSIFENFPTSLKNLILVENKISSELQEDVANLLENSDDEH